MSVSLCCLEKSKLLLLLQSICDSCDNVSVNCWLLLLLLPSSASAAAATTRVLLEAAIAQLLLLHRHLRSERSCSDQLLLLQ